MCVCVRHPYFSGSMKIKEFVSHVEVACYEMFHVLHVYPFCIQATPSLLLLFNFFFTFQYYVAALSLSSFFFF